MHPTRGTPDLSFVSGTSDRPLHYQTVDGVLKNAALGFPDRLALAAPFQSLRFNFVEFDTRVEQVARGMMGCGLEPGERIGIWAPNCAEWMLTMFAAARAGLVLVNINPAYRQTELAFALRLVGCRALVFAPRFKTSDYGAMLRSLIPELPAAAPGRLECAAFPELRLLVQLGTESASGTLTFEQLIAAGQDVDAAATASIEKTLDADQVFNIQFTSGTTGTPKGATLTHFNIVNNGFFVGEGMRLTANDRLCIPVPLYHCFGMVLGVLAAMTHGAACVLSGKGTLHGAARRANHVHRRIGTPTIRRVRFVVAANRYHGWIALSDRCDATRGGRDAHAGSDHLLRHDGNKPCQLSDPAG
jgi:fatty-acyl-CoA synthase